MSFYQYQCSSTIELHSMGVNRRGELFYTVCFIPDSLRRELPLKQYPRLRIDGEIHGIPIEAALQPAKGRWYVLISQAFMKEHELSLGDEVEIWFNIADQDFVDVPDELREAIDKSETAQEKWASLTAGKKRGYAAQVAAAKRQSTRLARAEKMIGFMLANKNAGGRPF
ncbi:MAG: YdeI/OmpD-associated family protein [Acidobacteriota bacterium]